MSDQKTDNMAKIYKTEADAESAGKRLCQNGWSYETRLFEHGWLLFLRNGNELGKPRNDETIHWFAK